jgi:nitrite reductase (NADH) large subunit
MWGRLLKDVPVPGVYVPIPNLPPHRVGAPMQQVLRPWPLLQAFAVASALAVLALLLIVPPTGLFVTWYVLIPIVPATLLVAPGLWRNLCPIATLSQLPSVIGRAPARRFPLTTRWGSTIGAALLFLIIVPLRPSIFNLDALALVVFTLSVIVVAVVGGFAYSGKGGWCSTLCPVLPVERLYGQRPIAEVEHAHCSSCDACVSGCYDLRPTGSLRGLTEPGRPESLHSWTMLRSPLGVFAAAFPGFVLGYFMLAPDATILDAYAGVVVYSVASLVVLSSADEFLLRNRALTLRVAAATAAALYYWFTIPAIAGAAERLVHLGTAPAWTVSATRVAMLALVALWFLLALREAPRRETELDVTPALD